MQYRSLKLFFLFYHSKQGDSTIFKRHHRTSFYGVLPTSLYCSATTSFSPTAPGKNQSSIFQTISIRSSL